MPDAGNKPFPALPATLKSAIPMGVAVHNARLLTVRGRKDSEEAIRQVGCDPGGVPLMAPKALHHTFKLERVDSRAALIIKQEMLSAGGDAAVCRGALGRTSRLSDVLVIGTRRQIWRALGKLAYQPFGCREIAAELSSVMANLDRGRGFLIKWSGRKLDMRRRTLVMGILNVTPDSFSDGGHFLDPSAAVEHGLGMVRDGADILDIGGESTRPGAAPLSLEAESRRVLPVIRRLSGKLDIPISIDTYKPALAARALDAGASLVNDIFGLRKKGMAEMVARRDVPVVVMHMRGTPRNMQKDPVYGDVVGEIHAFLAERLRAAQRAGVDLEKTVLDPGIGFGKTAGDNFSILARLGELRGLGRPLLVGASRKSFIGRVLDLPVERLLEGSLAAAAAAVLNGARIIRAHDVAETVRAARIADAISNAG